MPARRLLLLTACSLASTAAHALVPTAQGTWIAGLEAHFAGELMTSGLGSAVSISGDTAVVGAMREAGFKGAAYVFVRNGSSWMQQAKLVAPDGTGGDHFGISVALEGDTLVVGAYRDDLTGSAHVFARSGSTWTHEAVLVAPDGDGGDEFGYSVGLSGNTVVVGAPYDNHDEVTSGGSAHVFVRSGGSWSHQQKLVGLDTSYFDYLGGDVAVYGDTIVAGASGESNEGGYGAGSAYVFARTGALWSQQKKLTASDGGMLNAFGMSVSLWGDTALVGAFSAPYVGGNEGRAYVFVRQGTTWTEQAKLQASDGAQQDGFGGEVSLSGDLAVIGSTGHAQGSVLEAGAAYVFEREGTLWSEVLQLAAPEPVSKEWFGSSLGLSGDTAVFGIPAHDEPGKTDAGAAYAYRLLECPAAVPASEVVRLGTPPNPAALQAGQTNGPVLGAVWDPWIDHAEFMPGAAFDVLGVSATATSIPSSIGTLLCGTAPFLVVASLAAGDPFKIQLPLNCAAAGLALFTQGASLDAGGGIALTNALDIVLGTR